MPDRRRPPRPPAFAPGAVRHPARMLMRTDTGGRLPAAAVLRVLPRTGHGSPLARRDEGAGTLRELLARARITGTPSKAGG
jgi:hypothetical protein